MKKILLSVVCLIVVGMQSVNAQVAIAALHHNGSVTIYGQPLIQNAIDAAVQGDTLYLSEGTFSGFTVAKPIAIIGAGQTTVISGNVTIGSTDIATEEGLLLNGMRMLNNVNFYGVTYGVRISQCLMESGCSFSNNESDSFTNIEIVMSQIKGGLYLNATIKNISVLNSKIRDVHGYAGEGGATFLNCNVYSTNHGGNGNNNYINSIVDLAYTGYYKNCLWYSTNSGSTLVTLVDCQKPDSYFFDNTTALNCTLSDEELRNAGYLGTDGTVVGITGGDNPFTLVMSEMQITQGSLEVDNVEKKLKVTLTLGNK